MEAINERTAYVMVVSTMAHENLTERVRHFLKLSNVVSIDDEIAFNAVRQLQYELCGTSVDFQRLLLGVELALVLCERGESPYAITSGAGRVLKQYAKVLTELIIDNDSIRVGNVNTFCPFSKDEYELVLDIAHFIAVSSGSDSVGTINTLIRTIVARAPEEVLEVKIRQLESPDFCGDEKGNRERFHEVFAGEYLKRSYGLWQVLMQLWQSKETKMVSRDDWECYASGSEEYLWGNLKRNCEITEPTSDQLRRRQFLTSELMRRHPDNTVKKWYEDNFPHLVTT